MNDKESRALEKAIAVRKAQVARYLEFAIDILNNLGRITRRDESSDHTRIDKEFLNFAGFNLFGVFGMTYCGGNRVSITYPLSNSSANLVFSVYWQVGTEDCKVNEFYDDPNDPESTNWQTALDYAIDHKNEIIINMSDKKAKAAAKARKQEEDRRRSEALQKEAERLGLKLG